jgi:hypothetical protein
MPADHGLRLDDEEVGVPGRPEPADPHPEDAVGAAEARTGVCPEGNVELMAKREVLEGEVTVRSPQGQ